MDFTQQKMHHNWKMNSLPPSAPVALGSSTSSPESYIKISLLLWRELNDNLHCLLWKKLCHSIYMQITWAKFSKSFFMSLKNSCKVFCLDTSQNILLLFPIKILTIKSIKKYTCYSDSHVSQIPQFGLAFCILGIPQMVQHYHTSAVVMSESKRSHTLRVQNS